MGPQGDTQGTTRESNPDNKTRIEEHRCGHWAFGPFHLGPMSMSASFPQDLEAEVHRAWEEVEKRSQELVDQTKSPQRRIEGNPRSIDSEY